MRRFTDISGYESTIQDTMQKYSISRSAAEMAVLGFHNVNEFYAVMLRGRIDAEIAAGRRTEKTLTFADAVAFAKAIDEVGR